MIAEKIKDDQIRIYVNQEEYDMLIGNNVIMQFTIKEEPALMSDRQREILKKITDAGVSLISKEYKK